MFLFIIRKILAVPNVLIIVADDLGWNDIGLHNPRLKTPNIDSLIQDSIKLENYYVNPICERVKIHALLFYICSRKIEIAI